MNNQHITPQPLKYQPTVSAGVFPITFENRVKSVEITTGSDDTPNEHSLKIELSRFHEHEECLLADALEEFYLKNEKMDAERDKQYPSMIRRILFIKDLYIEIRCEWERKRGIPFPNRHLHYKYKKVSDTNPSITDIRKQFPSSFSDFEGNNIKEGDYVLQTKLMLRYNPGTDTILDKNIQMISVLAYIKQSQACHFGWRVYTMAWYTDCLVPILTHQSESYDSLDSSNRFHKVGNFKEKEVPDTKIELEILGSRHDPKFDFSEALKTIKETFIIKK